MARFNQKLGYRVIFGHQSKEAVLDAVNPGVSDIESEQAIRSETKSGYRGSHPGQASVGLGHIEKMLVETAKEAADTRLREIPTVRKSQDDLSARSFTRILAAHSIRDRQQPGPIAGKAPRTRCV
jgi:hypothetical protein